MRGKNVVVSLADSLIADNFVTPYEWPWKNELEEELDCDIGWPQWGEVINEARKVPVFNNNVEYGHQASRNKDRTNSNASPEEGYS